MRNQILISEIKSLKKLKLLNESEDEYYRISPKELENLFELSSNSSAVTRLPKFKGKKLYVTGNLDLSGRGIEDLGNIGYVDGSLNISRTNVGNISGVFVKKHVMDMGTPLEEKRIRKELEEKKEIANERREDKEWDLNNPNISDVGLKANALYQYFIDNGDINGINEEDVDRYNTLKSQIDELNKKFDEEENPDEYKKILDQIYDLEIEMEEIGPKFDVYDISPLRYKHYGDLIRFEVLNYDYKDKEYTVGTSDEMDEAAIDYAKSLIDDVGLDGYNESFIENYLDEGMVRDLFEEHYNDSVRDSPDSYFDSSDYQLTDEQEKRIEQLQEYIEEMEQLKSDTEEEMNELEYGNDEYLDLDEKIKEIESNIEKAQEELDNINVIEEPTEEMIEEKIESLVEEDMESPISRLKDFGVDIKDYVDTDAMAIAIADSDGWGNLNGYDGRYDDVKVNGEYFYVMRIN